jgi:competence CoiA-like predicted nuclease
MPLGHRPPVSCLGCGAPLMLRCGEVVRYHAARKARRRCWLSGGEAAAHLNTKLALNLGLETAPPVPKLHYTVPRLASQRTG